MAIENGANQQTVTPDVEGGVANTAQLDGVQDGGKTPASMQPENPKWMSQLPDELKGNEKLSKYNSLGEALSALLDGSKGDTKDAGKGQQGNEPDVEYNFSKDLSDSDDPDGIVRNTMKDAIKNMKLPQEEADKVYSSFVDTYAKIEEGVKKNAAEVCEKELKETWGDKYDENMASMKRAYKSLVPEGSDLDKGLKSTMAENNPFVVDLLAKIGKSISEHDPPRSKAVGQVKQKTGGFLTRENETYPW